jgi:hypothetical protein
VHLRHDIIGLHKSATQVSNRKGQLALKKSQLYPLKMRQLLLQKSCLKKKEKKRRKKRQLGHHMKW